MRTECVFLAAVLGVLVSGDFVGKPSLQPPVNPFTLGDVKWCAFRMGQTVERFEVLPGMGWDNLQNKDSGLWVRYNYSECRTTADRRYLLPDSVVTVPIKSS